MLQLLCCFYITEGTSTQAWIDLPVVKYYQLTNRNHLSFNATFNFSNNSGNEPIGLMTGR